MKLENEITTSVDQEAGDTQPANKGRQAAKPELDPGYDKYQIERTGKIPLRFRGKQLVSSGFKDEEPTELASEFGITVYQATGNNYVAVITEWVGNYEDDRVRTIRAGSLEDLAAELQDSEMMRVDSYSEVATHVLHQLFPDNPDYVETID